ncbi:hypothetical protein AKJ65_03085 [candidate division MSBL1 archaeon SCGC-AAA259E19]|uniref:ABC transmembrane type-1 domain-containing protein n=1 Tax=candidate division MSBL1 archaeon SCGC-AAA259E19 TaxID=1698264 RepID=A0A133UL11_9EURY|nr:hypothetical protein AKJ65_03085 [candidate division MSBL1 archaeon SCGC-AAA259E19]
MDFGLNQLDKNRVVLYAVLLGLLVLFLLPLWSPLMTALKTAKQSITTPPIQPPLHPTLATFGEALSRLDTGLKNSIIFTSVATVLSMIFGSVAGFVLTKIKFKGSRWVFLAILFGMFIPYQVVLIPLVRIMRGLGLFNTLWSLVLAHSAYGIPICTLIFRNFFGYIPDSLLESARTAGAGTWTIFRRIVLPLSKMAFVVAGIFQFTSIWNNFLFGLVLTPSQAKYPVTVALANLKGTTSAGGFPLLMAGGFITAIPVLIIYLFLGRYLMRGYMAGAVK